MAFYKLDKYDRIFIAFILVILVIYNINQCFASEDVELNSYQGLGINVGGAVLSPNSNSKIYYVELEPNYNYTITLNDSFTSLRYGFGNELIDGAEVFNPTFVGNGSEFTFSFNSNNYNYLYFYLNDVQNYTSPSGTIVTREPISNMALSVDNLVNNAGFNQLWSVFESGIDFIGVVVLVAFGFLLIVLLIKKLSKGKSDY